MVLHHFLMKNSFVHATKLKKRPNKLERLQKNVSWKQKTSVEKQTWQSKNTLAYFAATAVKILGFIAMTLADNGFLLHLMAFVIS